MALTSVQFLDLPNLNPDLTRTSVLEVIANGCALTSVLPFARRLTEFEPFADLSKMSRADWQKKYAVLVFETTDGEMRYNASEIRLQLDYFPAEPAAALVSSASSEVVDTARSIEISLPELERLCSRINRFLDRVKRFIR